MPSDGHSVADRNTPESWCPKGICSLCDRWRKDDQSAAQDAIAQIRGDSVYLNQSRIGDFLRCEELYHLNYEFYHPDAVEVQAVQGGLASRSTSLALSTGSAYHAGISFYYHHGRDVAGAVAEAWRVHDEARISAVAMLEEAPLWDKDKAILDLLIKSYHLKYRGEALQVLMPEASGVAKLGSSPHYLVFRTDAVYSEYNQIGLLEYKTKGRTPSGLEVATIHTALQPTAYVYGVNKVTGLKAMGVRYRWAIKKPEYELNRLHLQEYTHRTSQDLQRFEDEAIDIAERILRLRKTGGWIHNWNQCTTFGECAMRRLCIHHRDPAVIALYKPRGIDYVDEATIAGAKEGKLVGQDA